MKSAPLANAQTLSTLVSQAVPVTLTGSDTNMPALPLAYNISAVPAHGVLSGTAPNLTYTPEGGYFGSDSFAFTVNNGVLTRSPASVAITITQSSISGTVALQGWTGAAQPLTFVLTPTGTTQGAALTQTLTPTAAGAFSLANIPAGTYTLGIKGAKWLRKDVPIDITAGNVTNLSVTLPTGDANNDNRITLTDLALARAAFNSAPGAPNWNPNADFNGDGRVTLADLALQRANFNAAGDP